MDNEKRLKALRELYYSPEGFVGPAKLQKRLLQRGVALSQEEIQKWLRSDPIAGPESKPQRKVAENARRFNVITPNAVHSVDLLFLPTDPDTKEKYVLTLVDLASRYKAARGLKRKDASTVAKALADIYTKSKQLTWPKVISHDPGKEFAGSFAALMKKHGVEVRKGQRGDHRHAGMVESFNRWLAERLFKAMRARAKQEGKDDDLRWTYLLQPMVAAFNSEDTRLLGMSPDEAIQMKHVPQPEEPKVKSLKKRKILAIGTPVRVLLPEPDEKGRFRATDPQWSKKIYKITGWRFNGTFHPITYKTDANPDRWLVREALLPQEESGT